MKYSYRDVFYPQIVRVPDQAAATSQLKPGVIVLVMPADKPKWLKFFCPCGCGEVVSVNLMPQAAKAWRCAYAEGKGLSLYPSVWLDVGCKSHFILRNNTARLLFGKPPRGFWSEEDF